MRLLEQPVEEISCHRDLRLGMVRKYQKCRHSP